jgi:hypothetical protein
MFFSYCDCVVFYEGYDVISTFLHEVKYMKRYLLIILTSLFFTGLGFPMNALAQDLIIDDRSTGSTTSNLGEPWRLFTDRVMGGISNGSLKPDQYAGRNCLRMNGQVSTENNGGFVQMALDLNSGKAFDASAYQGLELEVAGNNEEYNLHYRTSGLWLPWQSFRASFKASTQWSKVRIPFHMMKPYRTGQNFRPNKIKRLGLVAIGKNFEADLCVGKVSFYAK